MPKYQVNTKCFGFKGKLYEEGEIVEVADGVIPPKFFTLIEDEIVSPVKQAEVEAAQDTEVPTVVDPTVPPAALAGKGKGSVGKVKGSTGKAKAK